MLERHEEQNKAERVQKQPGLPLRHRTDEKQHLDLQRGVASNHNFSKRTGVICQVSSAKQN